MDGPVPQNLADGVPCGPLHQVAPGAVLFTLPTVGRFLATADAPVVVDRAPGATDADVATFVGSNLRAARHLLAGRFSLRGSAVEVDGTAVVVAGLGAVGTSVLAGAMVGRGMRLLADDVVTIDDQGRALAADGALRLQPKGASLLGVAPEDGTPLRPGLEKRSFPVARAEAPVPIGTIVRLEVDRTVDRVTLGPMPPTERLPALLAPMWHHDFVPTLGLKGALFRWVTTTLRSVEVLHLVRPPRNAAPGDIADLVVEAAR